MVRVTQSRTMIMAVSAMILVSCAPAKDSLVTDQTPQSLLTVTVTAVSTTTVTATVQAPPAAPQPSPVASQRADPVGAVAITKFSGIADTRTCSTVEVTYDNRSDRAVNSITQEFLVYYYPKHDEGTYPDLKEGARKSATQIVGIAAYSVKTVRWQLCAPELSALQNPPGPNPQNYMEKIASRPDKFSWEWVP